MYSIKKIVEFQNIFLINNYQILSVFFAFIYIYF